MELKSLEEKDNVTIDQCNILELGWWVNKNNRIFTRNHFCYLNDVIKYIQSRNNFGIFTTAYRYNNTNQDESYLYGDFYLDFDDEDFEKVREDAMCALNYLEICYGIKNNSCNIYFSGRKGVHIVVPAYYFNIQPIKELNIVFKFLANKINNFVHHKTIDLQIYDNKRLFRVPNTVHEKSLLYKVPLTYYELSKSSYEYIINKARSPQPIIVNNEFNKELSFANYKKTSKQALQEYRKSNCANITYKGTLSVTPPCITNLLENGAKKFTRNNSIAILSSFYKSCGKSYKETLDIIRTWNNTKNLPPTGDIELTRTVKSIYSTQKTFGCTKIKTILQCYEDICPLKNKGRSDKN